MPNSHIAGKVWVQKLTLMSNQLAKVLVAMGGEPSTSGGVATGSVGGQQEVHLRLVADPIALAEI